MYESQESITIEYDNGMPNRMENSPIPLDTAAESSTRDASADASAIDALAQTIEKTIDPMGYELVWLEVVNHRTGALRIFIDKAKPSESGITVEDCAAVSRALDEVLDTKVDTLGVFSGTYELEVSSPGINRPLWRAKDYLRFAGREARIHLIRPLLPAESRNEAYSQKNPKQKNFFGLLEGVEISGADPQASLICLKIIPEGSAKGVQRPQKKKKNSENSERSLESICIPMGLVQKAHLEPTFSAAVLLEEASDSNSFTRKES